MLKLSKLFQTEEKVMSSSEDGSRKNIDNLKIGDDINHDNDNDFLKMGDDDDDMRMEETPCAGIHLKTRINETPSSKANVDSLNASNGYVQMNFGTKKMFI